MDIVKKSLKSLGVYGASKFAISILSVATLMLLSRMLSNKEYAIVSFIILARPFIYSLISLEISQAAPIFFVDTKNKLKKKLIFSTGLFFSLSVCLLVLGLSFFIARRLCDNIEERDLLLILCSLFLGALVYYCLIMLRWQDRQYTYCAISFIASAVLLGGLFSSYLLHSHSIHLVYVSWFYSFLFAAILSLYFTRVLFIPKLSFRLLKKMVKFSFPLLLSKVPSTANAMIDRYVVLWMMGINFAGIYSAAYAMVPLAVAIVSIFNDSFGPIIYQAHGQNQGEEKVQSLFFKFATSLAFLSIIITLMSKPILTLLLNSNFSQIQALQQSAPILVLGTLISSMMVFFPGIAIEKKSHLSVIVASFSLMINAILSFLFVHIWGIQGAAVAFLLASVFQLIMHASFSKRYFQFKKLNSTFLCFFMLYFFAFFLASYMDINLVAFSAVSIIVRLSLISGVLILFMYIWQRKGERGLVQSG
jgi:O-antigen/teichoic acid export membrane protein